MFREPLCHGGFVALLYFGILAADKTFAFSPLTFVC